MYIDKIFVLIPKYSNNFKDWRENSSLWVAKPFSVNWPWSSCFFKDVYCSLPHVHIRGSEGGFICTFSHLISLPFTFQSSKFNCSSSSKCCLTRTDDSNESVQMSFQYPKRDRTRKCFLFSVTCHIRIYWPYFEMIPELIVSYWLLK